MILISRLLSSSYLQGYGRLRISKVNLSLTMRCLFFMVLRGQRYPQVSSPSQTAFLQDGQLRVKEKVYLPLKNKKFTTVRKHTHSFVVSLSLKRLFSLAKLLELHNQWYLIVIRHFGSNFRQVVWISPIGLVSPSVPPANKCPSGKCCLMGQMRSDSLAHQCGNSPCSATYILFQTQNSFTLYL